MLTALIIVSILLLVSFAANIALVMAVESVARGK